MFQGNRVQLVYQIFVSLSLLLSDEYLIYYFTSTTIIVWVYRIYRNIVHLIRLFSILRPGYNSFLCHMFKILNHEK